MLEQAVTRALQLRGTVMLAVRENRRRWCAVCAAVDGSLELRVGEPGSVWRRRERRRGEAWLRDHGFVHVVDAWAKPVARGTHARSCAEMLDHALREGLGAGATADLVEVLVHPGPSAQAAPPAPGASHAEHIRFALAALARHGRGKLVIEGGRPASTWAWAFVIDDQLVLSPESADDGDEWKVPLAEQDVAGAASRLTELLHGELGRDRHAPLFISCMPLEPPRGARSDAALERTRAEVAADTEEHDIDDMLNAIEEHRRRRGARGIGEELADDLERGTWQDRD